MGSSSHPADGLWGSLGATGIALRVAAAVAVGAGLAAAASTTDASVGGIYIALGLALAAALVAAGAAQMAQTRRAERRALEIHEGALAAVASLRAGVAEFESVRAALLDEVATLRKMIAADLEARETAAKSASSDPGRVRLRVALDEEQLRVAFLDEDEAHVAAYRYALTANLFSTLVEHYADTPKLWHEGSTFRAPLSGYRSRVALGPPRAGTREAVIAAAEAMAASPDTSAADVARFLRRQGLSMQEVADMLSTLGIVARPID